MMPTMVSSCLQFANVTDEAGNPPLGYRLLITWDGSQKWHHSNSVVHHLTYSEANHGSCGFSEDRGGLEDAPFFFFLSYLRCSSCEYVWITVQPYDVNGVGKGDGWGRGEVGFYHNVESAGSYIDRPENAGAEEQE